MSHVGLHRTHLDILEHAFTKERTVSQIAAHIGKSISWTSLCIRHLARMELVTKRKVGLEVLVRPASNDLSHSLELLMVEAPLVNLSGLLDRAGLTLLPVMVDPGATTTEMAQRTGLSMPTIRNRMRRWRGMGVVVRDGGTKRYTISSTHKELRAFVVVYSRWHNRRMLEDVLPDALMVWQWRDEYMFSIDHKVNLPDFSSAGPTRLEELEYDILILREYYHYHPTVDIVSEEEALVQSLRTDRNNPRLLAFIKEGIENRGLAPEAILDFGRKYGLKTVLKELVSVHG